jgi:hypothetical protein
VALLVGLEGILDEEAESVYVVPLEMLLDVPHSKVFAGGVACSEGELNIGVLEVRVHGDVLIEQLSDSDAVVGVGHGIGDCVIVFGIVGFSP